jgi:hypothetical protein
MARLSVFASLALVGSFALSSAQAASVLTASPADVSWARSVTVTWSGVPGTSKYAWIGLFRVGADDTDYQQMWYVSCEDAPIGFQASGSCSLPLDPSGFSFAGPSANYEFRLFADADTTTRVAVSNPITMTHGGTPVGPTSARISVDTAAISGPRSVTVSWSGIPDASKYAWIGLFRAGADDTDYQDLWYVSCESAPIAARAAGSCTLPLDPDQFSFSGTSASFEFRLFADGNNARLAISNPVTLTHSQ